MYKVVADLPLEFAVKAAEESYSEAETERRREAALKKMLATPPSPRTAKEKPKPKRRKAKKDR